MNTGVVFSLNVQNDQGHLEPCTVFLSAHLFSSLVFILFFPHPYFHLPICHSVLFFPEQWYDRNLLLVFENTTSNKKMWINFPTIRNSSRDRHVKTSQKLSPIFSFFKKPSPNLPSPKHSPSLLPNALIHGLSIFSSITSSFMSSF